jgi:hypothetical protein
MRNTTYGFRLIWVSLNFGMEFQCSCLLGNNKFKRLINGIHRIHKLYRLMMMKCYDNDNK